MPYSVTALSGRLILVAEDEYMLADAIVAAIESAGGNVLGPFPSVEESLRALASAERQPDSAALNIRLLDGESYALADELRRRSVPFVFASANRVSLLPSRFSRSPMVGKPYAAYQVVQALTALLAPAQAAS